MRLERKRLDELLPAPYNPRVELSPRSSAYRKLRRSIEQFGLVEPLIWNRRSGRVVAGHQRLRILRDLGVAEADVSVVDLDDEDERALNVLLNNREAQSDFDPARLRELLAGLEKRGKLARTGFDPRHLRILEFELNPPPPLRLDPPPAAALAWEVLLRIPADRFEQLRAALDPLIRELALEVQVRRGI